MSANSSNNAKRVDETTASPIDEPSMDEILASIKKIISDDEAEVASLEDREQYTHPTDHSNSNDALEEMETELEAAIESDLQDVVSDLPDTAIDATPANNPTQAIDGVLPTAPQLSQGPLDQKAEQVRREQAQRSEAKVDDPRLEKYRVRGN